MKSREGARRFLDRLREDDGSSIIGWRLVFPLVVFMTFGVFQYILYGLGAEEVSTAAREGARRAALDGSSFADGAAFAQSFVNDGLVTNGAVSVSGSRGDEQTTMTVTAQCKWIIDPALFGADSCTITRTEVVPTEGFIDGIIPS